MLRGACDGLRSLRRRCGDSRAAHGVPDRVPAAGGRFSEFGVAAGRAAAPHVQRRVEDGPRGPLFPFKAPP